MGVSRTELPTWDDRQFMTAQLATSPQLDDVAVRAEVVIGLNAKKPLRVDLPLFVSDMSFGAVSEEAGMLLEAQAENPPISPKLSP